jgi:hypothetical protein
MFAKKLGRFTASLFVAFGLAFGGGVLVVAGGNGSATAAAPITASIYTADVDWQ